MPDPELIGSIIESTDLLPTKPHQRFEVLWHRWAERIGGSFPLPPGWRGLITEFAEAGLSEEDFAHAVEHAIGHEGSGKFEKFRATLAQCRLLVAQRGGTVVAPRTLTQSADDPGSDSVGPVSERANLFFAEQALQEERRRWKLMCEQERSLRPRPGDSERARILRDLEERDLLQDLLLDLVERKQRWLQENGPFVFNLRSGVFHHSECAFIRRSLGLVRATRVPTAAEVRCPRCFDLLEAARSRRSESVADQDA